jgi:hypothetical protein
MNNKDIIEEINRRLKHKFKDFKGSYLYGKALQKDYFEDHYIDMVSIFESLDPTKEREIFDIVGKLEYKMDIFIDIQTMTPRELSLNPFFYNEVVERGEFYAGE